MKVWYRTGLIITARMPSSSACLQVRGSLMDEAMTITGRSGAGRQDMARAASVPDTSGIIWSSTTSSIGRPCDRAACSTDMAASALSAS